MNNTQITIKEMVNYLQAQRDAILAITPVTAKTPQEYSILLEIQTKLYELEEIKRKSKKVK